MSMTEDTWYDCMTDTVYKRPAAANALQEEKPVRYISAEDHEAQKLWREVVLLGIQQEGFHKSAIETANAVAQAYIKFVNNQENN